MDPSPKQQVSEQLKNAKSVLVTTSNNPSVDDVASVMGLTYLLQAMKKHASAVISSSTPAALKFLNPDDIIENSTDKLRDFVVSFDKEKADKLRYKVEDDQVKIFITPYKTIITQEDFQFTQGDFNVDSIVVIGATKRNELDEAVLKHSRILHEAEIITINAGADNQAEMGSINWHEPTASSVSELLVSISEALGSGLLNKDSAQALLTGIVAATDMFSNTATSPKVMTMSAQLMAAGADQQLIMKELKAGQEISEHAQELPPETVQAEKKTDAEAKPAPKEDDDVMLDLGATHKADEEAKKQKQAQKQEQATDKKQEETPSKQPKPALDTSEHPRPSRAREHKIITEQKADQPQPALEHQDQQFSHSVHSQPAAGNSSVNAQAQPQSHVEQKPRTPAPQPATPSPSSELPEPPETKPTPQQQPPQPAAESHINVHPQLPTLSKTKQNQPAQASTPTPNPTSEKEPAPQAPTPQAVTQEQDDAKTNELEAARKAVQDAIASQPSPLPVSRESTNSQEVPEDGGDIHIDHEGNIRS